MVSEQLTAKSFTERCRIKAAAFGKLATPIQFSVGKMDLTIVAIKQRDNLLHVQAVAERAGKRLEIDGDIWIVNPPILVPDGGGYREDLEAALRSIVADALSIEEKHVNARRLP